MSLSQEEQALLTEIREEIKEVAEATQRARVSLIRALHMPYEEPMSLEELCRRAAYRIGELEGR